MEPFDKLRVSGFFSSLLVLHRIARGVARAYLELCSPTIFPSVLDDGETNLGTDAKWDLTTTSFLLFDDP